MKEQDIVSDWFESGNNVVRVSVIKYPQVVYDFIVSTGSCIVNSDGHKFYKIGDTWFRLVSEEPKKILFTTEDGVDMYKGDDGFSVSLSTWDIMRDTASEINNLDFFTLYKLFKSKEAAEDYVLRNQKLLSLNDLLDAWENIPESLKDKQLYSRSPLFANFVFKAKENLHN